MRSPIVTVVLSAALFAALLASVHVWASPSPTAASAQATMFSPPRQLVLYGHVRAIQRSGREYRLRFDPAHWLGGVTARRAAVEDGVVRPGEAVPNDYYIREDGHRLLTYRLRANARVTVLTTGPRGFRSTPISVAELAQIVRGRNPRGRALADRRGVLGFWIRVATDTVRSLDQQYQP